MFQVSCWRHKPRINGRRCVLTCLYCESSHLHCLQPLPCVASHRPSSPITTSHVRDKRSSERCSSCAAGTIDHNGHSNLSYSNIVPLITPDAICRLSSFAPWHTITTSAIRLRARLTLERRAVALALHTQDPAADSRSAGAPAYDFKMLAPPLPECDRCFPAIQAKHLPIA